MPFLVYILKCADASYYTGHTDNLEKRLASHQSGEVESYTSARLPVELVFCETFGTRVEALEMERRIKGWSRAKKEALMRGDWKRIQQLAWGAKNPLPESLR
jgi:predicted GIY-YIG superfamily endonuclease